MRKIYEIRERCLPFFIIKKSEADSGGAIFYANDAFAENLGYKKIDLIGKTIDSMRSGRDSFSMKLMTKKMDTEGCFNEFAEFLRINGKDVRYSLEAFNIKVDEDDALMVFCHEDEESGIKFDNAFCMAQIVRYTDAAIIAVDKFKEVNSWNDAAEEMFGYHLSEAIGEELSSLIGSEGKELEKMMDRIEQGDKIARQDIKCIKQDNSEIYVSITISPIKNNQKKISGFSIIAHDISERMKAEEKLSNSEDNLRRLAQNIEDAREEERKHIAAEVHDELGQSLTALQLDLTWLKKKMPDMPFDIQEKLVEMSEKIQKTSKQVSHISQKLRPTVLDDFGLIAAMQWQVNEYKKRTNIDFHFSYNVETVKIDQEKKTAVFRIFQELLTNIVKHAKASEAIITVKNIDNLLEMNIEDDGVGLVEKNLEKKDSFGLIGIKERARRIGADFKIDSSEDGTIARLKLNI